MTKPITCLYYKGDIDACQTRLATPLPASTCTEPTQDGRWQEPIWRNSYAILYHALDSWITRLDVSALFLASSLGLPARFVAAEAQVGYPAQPAAPWPPQVAAHTGSTAAGRQAIVVSPL